MNKTGLKCVQRSCNHHQTYRISLLAGFDGKCLNPLHSWVLFSEMKPIRPLSVQNLPPCENTLQLVRNAQLAAGAGDGVWSKPPEKCRCCYCRRSDSRRIAADAGAEQSSTGRVVDTTKINQNLVQTKFTSSEKCKTYRRRYVQVLQEQMRSSDARDAAPASCNL